LKKEKEKTSSSVHNLLTPQPKNQQFKEEEEEIESEEELQCEPEL